AGDQTDFLFTFTLDRVFRRLPGIDAPRWHFPEFSVDTGAVLTNQNHLTIALHRNDHDRWTVADHLNLVFRAVRVLPLFDLDRKHPTFEDDRHSQILTGAARVPGCPGAQMPRCPSARGAQVPGVQAFVCPRCTGAQGALSILGT